MAWVASLDPLKLIEIVGSIASIISLALYLKRKKSRCRGNPRSNRPRSKKRSLTITISSEEKGDD
jgi:hypothetical protein